MSSHFAAAADARMCNAIVSQPFLEGFHLEVSVLQSLLRRHRTSHGRTLYYKRMEMALKPILSNYIMLDVTSRLETLQRTVQQQHLQEQSRKRKIKGKSLEDEEWSLMVPPKPDTTTINTETIQRLWNEFQMLVTLFTEGIQETLSRIHHASRALFVEVSRGFFLPFCSVALGALARIRAMLMHIGRMGLIRLKNRLQPDLLTLLEGGGGDTKSSTIQKSLSAADFEKHMAVFLNDDGNNKKKKPQCQAEILDEEELLMVSMGLTQAKTNEKKVVLGNAKVAAPSSLEDTMDDIGVSVEHIQQPNHDDAGTESVAKLHKGDSNSASCYKEEGNMLFVESFKRKQQQQKSQDSESAKKPKTTPIPNLQKPAIKKEKKKKKKPKGNFFDNLFDS
jgi:hypothetical protein